MTIALEKHTLSVPGPRSAITHRRSGFFCGICIKSKCYVYSHLDTYRVARSPKRNFGILYMKFLDYILFFAF